MQARKPVFDHLLDRDVFISMLKGIFSSWTGNYDVLLADTNEYLDLPKGRSSFHLLFQEVRLDKQGSKMCLDDDIYFATLAAKRGVIITYYDHIGLFNAAVPVFVDDQWIATIFFGHLFPLDEKQKRELREKVENIEKTLKLPRNSLWKIAEKIPSEPSIKSLDKWKKLIEDFVETIPPKISRQNKLIDELAQERDLLEQKQQELILSLHSADQRSAKLLATSNILQKTTTVLRDVTIPWQEFWHRTNDILFEISNVIDAIWIAIFVPYFDGEQQLYVVSSNSSLNSTDAEFFVNGQSTIGSVMNRIVNRERLIIDSDAIEFNHFKSMLNKQGESQFEENLSQIWLLSIDLEEDLKGILLVFHANDTEDAAKLTIQDEYSLLEQFTLVINTVAYHRLLYKRNREEQRKKLEWVERITHQLMNPLNGLNGVAYVLKRNLERWKEQKPAMFMSWSTSDYDRLNNRIEEISHLIIESVRIANNLSWANSLAWVAYGDNEKITRLILQRQSDMAGLLISCAREFQGLATLRNVRTVTVVNDKQEFSFFDNRVDINEDRFRQAIGNLIENAIKYCEPSTIVYIRAKRDGNWGEIQVVNEGIRLRNEDIEPVFDLEYRTSEAKAKEVTGTGIGLAVARQIIELHNGTLTAQPSIKGDFGWITTFTVRLPLQNL